MSIPLSNLGDVIDFDTPDPGLAHGVKGYAILDRDTLYIPVIEAVKRGSGDVGRFLDSLPLDMPVVVPEVINPRLELMLYRRGFHLGVEWSEHWEEWVWQWQREPQW